jgi:hypothetical protein
VGPPLKRAVDKDPAHRLTVLWQQVRRAEIHGFGEVMIEAGFPGASAILFLPVPR